MFLEVESQTAEICVASLLQFTPSHHFRPILSFQQWDSDLDATDLSFSEGLKFTERVDLWLKD